MVHGAIQFQITLSIFQIHIRVKYILQNNVTNFKQNAGLYSLMKIKEFTSKLQTGTHKSRTVAIVSPKSCIQFPQNSERHLCDFIHSSRQ